MTCRTCHGEGWIADGPDVADRIDCPDCRPEYDHECDECGYTGAPAFPTGVLRGDRPEYLCARHVADRGRDLAEDGMRTC